MKKTHIKIDSFSHIAPLPFRDAVLSRANGKAGFEMWTMPCMTDPKARMDTMDEFGIDMQVLTTPSPPLDESFSSPVASELARLANDSLAALVAKFPDRFIGVATISLGDVKQALQEARRAVEVLGLSGVLVYTSQRGRAIDRPELEDFYHLLEEMAVPMWLHPCRGVQTPDYAKEERSLFGMFLIFGWPYETSLAMARLVLGGVMERHPHLRIVAHHAGAMIPRLSSRIAHDYRTPHRDAEGLRRPAMEYFREFYADTITQGSPGALMSAYETFGGSRLLFATDMPFGGGDGRAFARMEMDALESLPIPKPEKIKIWSTNLLALCGLKLAADRS